MTTNRPMIDYDAARRRAVELRNKEFARIYRAFGKHLSSAFASAREILVDVRARLRANARWIWFGAQ